MSMQSIMPGETRSLTIHVSDRVFAGLVERSRVAGYTPALYAKLLFEAAYAARCGKGEGDPALEACVAKSFERRPGAPVSKVVTTRPSAHVLPVLVPIILPVPIPTSSGETTPAPTRRRDTAMHRLLDAGHGACSAAAIVFRLIARDEGASRTEIHAALAPSYATMDRLAPLMSRLRVALRGQSISLETVDVWGWRIAAADRAAAQALLEEDPS